jgi:hypothetical protein
MAGKTLAVAGAAIVLALSSLACCCGVPTVIREGLEVGWPFTSVRGSGSVVEEERDLTGFSSIALRGIGRVKIEQGDAPALRIEAEDNLIPYIETRVEGTMLVIRARERTHLRPTRPLVFHVTVVDLDRLEISGSGDADADGLTLDDLSLSVSGSGDVAITDLQADAVEARISGSGSIDLSGSARNLDLSITGSGDYRAAGLETVEAKVRISGSGSALLNASDQLEARISGSGSVRYVGNPSVVSSVTGSGSVRPARD